MKRILHLSSSIRGAASESHKLGSAIVARILQQYPGSIIEAIDLSSAAVPHMTPATLQLFFTPPDELSDEGRQALYFSDTAVQQLRTADIIVIDAPLYNFSIPSTLKAWLDHVTRAGVTFRYSETGPVGLLTGKTVYIAMASGGVYSEGPMEQYDFAVPYLRQLLRFLGMTDVHVFRAEGLKVPGVMEHALQKGIDSIVIS